MTSLLVRLSNPEGTVTLAPTIPRILVQPIALAILLARVVPSTLIPSPRLTIHLPLTRPLRGVILRQVQ